MNFGGLYSRIAEARPHMLLMMFVDSFQWGSWKAKNLAGFPVGRFYAVLSDRQKGHTIFISTGWYVTRMILG